MKTLATAIFLIACGCPHLQASAQTGPGAHQALFFADSLNRAFQEQHWNDYMSLSHPGVVSYYGGSKEFREHATRASAIRQAAGETIQKLDLVQMIQHAREWQCVIRKTSEASIDGRKTQLITYLVGQSKDEGRHWNYVDMDTHSADDLVYLMPDKFDALSVPQREVVFDKDDLVRQN